MPGPGRAFFCQPLVVCTPQALLLYELSVYTMQFAGRQLPALRSIPMCHIRSKITLPHTFTSSSTTSGKPQPAPQPSPGHIPIFPILHIRHDNGLPHTILSSSDRTGKPQPAPQPSPDHIPPFPHPTHQEQNHPSSHFYLLICNIGAITLRKSKARSEPPIELGAALCFSRRRSFIPAALRK